MLKRSIYNIPLLCLGVPYLESITSFPCYFVLHLLLTNGTPVWWFHRPTVQHDCSMRVWVVSEGKWGSGQSSVWRRRFLVDFFFFNQKGQNMCGAHHPLCASARCIIGYLWSRCSRLDHMLLSIWTWQPQTPGSCWLWASQAQRHLLGIHVANTHRVDLSRDHRTSRDFPKSSDAFWLLGKIIPTTSLTTGTRADLFLPISQKCTVLPCLEAHAAPPSPTPKF